MESVEVWMWLVAGVILGGIIFVSAFVFIGNYTSNMEYNQAQDSYNLLKDTINKVCQGGPYSQEVVSYVFPRVVNLVYSEDDNGIKGSGSNLCIHVQKDAPHCQKLQSCSITMQSINLQQKQSVLYFVQKALGKKKPTKIKFTVAKVGKSDINITWKKTLE
jgi:hypothetical protein